MKKIKDIDTALAIFEEAAIKQAEATETGDYKTGNKHYDEITKAVAFIKNENAVESLKPFLSHSSIGVRLWAACYLLPVDEKQGVKTLEEIAKSSGIHSLTADTTLSEWKKGNLKF
ncbi:MAG: DUF2019 domain-containing protein [Bacteroidota bacterium]